MPRINTFKVGIPLVLVAAALMAAMALWAYNGAAGGLKDGVGFKGLIEYSVFDAAGNLKEHKVIPNTITANSRNGAWDRLIGDPNTYTTATDGPTGRFNNIAVLGTADAVLTDGVLAANVLLLVDGLNTVAGTIMNPATGVATDTGDGVGTVVATFLAVGNPANAVQLLLVSTVPDDTSTGGAADIAAAEIFATQTISVDLADTDTLQVTWTVTVTG